MLLKFVLSMQLLWIFVRLNICQSYNLNISLIPAKLPYTFPWFVISEENALKSTLSIKSFDYVGGVEIVPVMTFLSQPKLFWGDFLKSHLFSKVPRSISGKNWLFCFLV